MKYAIAAWGETGFEIVRYCLRGPHELGFVILRPDNEWSGWTQMRCEEEGVPVHVVNSINEASLVEKVKESVDVGILAWWPEVLKRPVIQAVSVGWLNLHPSLLPWGKGKHAYFWSIFHEEPFGVTLHWVNEGIDTGPIVAQEEIEVTLSDTGESLYLKGRDKVVWLFKNWWAQPTFDYVEHTGGSYHNARDIDRFFPADYDIDIDTLNFYRARTFERGTSGTMRDESGKLWEVKVHVSPA